MSHRPPRASEFLASQANNDRAVLAEKAGLAPAIEEAKPDVDRKEEVAQLKELGPKQLLERWGLRVSGTSLDAPVKPLSTAQGMGADIDLAVVSYVGTTTNYKRSVSVLFHVFGKGASIYDFRMFEPGDTLMLACLRLGWCELLAKVDPPEMPRFVLRDFKERIEERCRVEPFLIPKFDEDEDDVRSQIFCDVPDHMRSFFPRGYGLPQNAPKVRSESA